jgi:hypothetical protein
VGDDCVRPHAAGDPRRFVDLVEVESVQTNSGVVEEVMNQTRKREKKQQKIKNKGNEKEK